jgi:hypothetical protein
MSILIIEYPYLEVYSTLPLPEQFILGDHLYGFNQNLTNQLLNHLNDRAKQQNTTFTILTDQPYPKKIHDHYPNLKIKLDIDINKLGSLKQYTMHPALNFKNFVCSFNGAAHVSRKLLVSALKKFGYFNSDYCSKNFSFTEDIIDGHITDYVADRGNFYRKFFIADGSEAFFNTINSFGHVQYDHANNIYNLETKLTESFLHLVSETMATSYYPFVTEKFLYSIVTRGLFLAYAQPGWHAHLEKYYGFKRYTRIFDYRFDAIQNPVERLVELMSMISKFSKLSTDEWKDLYEMEVNTIEYNHQHYFSGDYLNILKTYA